MKTSAKPTERPAVKPSSPNLTRGLAGRWPTGLSAAALVLLTSLTQAANPTRFQGTTTTVPHGAQRLERPDQVPDGVSAPDWARIRAQLETARYAIRPVVAHSDPGRYEAWNQEEQLHAQFAKGGVSLVGNAEAGQSAASARLAFMGYRYGQTLEPVSEPTLVALGNRIEYRRGSITEWYVNDPRGVEQGFCLAQRPAGPRDAGPLRLELGIEGTLYGELRADGQAVLLRDGSGVERMRYSGLKAWDARHQELAAKLETTGGVIVLVVEEGEAVYPVTIDPLITMTETKQLAPVAAGNAEFGYSVSISGDTVVVGAFEKNSGAGAAYVFDRNTGGANNWGQVKELGARDAAVGDFFGSSASISGDTVVVGAYAKNSYTGATYVFDRNNGGANNWGQVKRLTANDAAGLDNFGFSVSVSGDSVVVGAYGKDSTGVAYVFDRNNGGANNWGQVQKLTASDAVASDLFGHAVSISGDTVAVGAFAKNSGTGAAYVFDRNNGGANNWGQVQELSPSDAAANDAFGFSVSISADTLVVGAPVKDSSSGAAYVFDRNNGGGNNWGQVRKLAASDAAAGNQFGHSVSITADTAVVGAYVRNFFTGAAYVFDRNNGGGNNWGQLKILTASDAAAGDAFGDSVSISGDTVVAGAPGKNSNTGAAYVFDRNNSGANNWGQAEKLSASDAAGGDEFGYSVSISGDTVVVGAIGKNVASGAAYVFDRNNGGANNWGQVQKLTPSDVTANDAFGFSVSISGDTLVVAALGKNSFTGAAYVFDRNNGGANNWGQVQKLTASDAQAGDQFGVSVSISGDTVVVGAFAKNSGTGVAYMFDRNYGGPNNWGQARKLTASDAEAGDGFGYSVSISGDTLVVGANAKNSAAGADAGAAYVFDRDDGGANNWGQTKILTASDGAAGDQFGYAVSISGDTVVVGAFSRNILTGAAYVFDRNNGGANNWGQTKILTASDAATFNDFGLWVSISGDTMAVGAPFKNGGTGAAYVFDRYDGGANNWGQTKILTASDGAVSDLFGWSLAISQDIVVIGAPLKSPGTGAAYLFDLPAAVTPTTTTINSPSGQYSDKVTLRATVSPAAAGTVQFSVNGSAVASPLTVSGGGATYDYTILLPVRAGGYLIQADFTSTDAGYSDSSGTGTLTVTRENATVTPRSSNPLTVKVNTAGGAAGPVTLVADISEVADGTLGDIAKAVPVTFTLTPLGGGSSITQEATVSGSGVGPLVASVTLTLVPVNVYDITISIGGNFYIGSAESCLAVYDPSLGFVTGGGKVVHGGVGTQFAFSAKYVKSGQVQGSLMYVEHRASGDVVLNSNSMGTMAIVGATALLTGKATLGSVGNYKFLATVVDGDPGTSDKFGLKVNDPSGAVVTSLTFDPLTLSGGNIVVPHK
jgi:hypothetical protein